MNKKIMLFFIVGFISILFLTNFVAFAPKIYMAKSSYWKAKVSMTRLLENDTDTVIFGDSIANGGYRVLDLGDRVFNFALDGSSPIEGYFLLKYMVNNGKRPKNVVLTYFIPDWYDNNNYWDQQLAFRSDVITRDEAREILKVDQNSVRRTIAPYVGAEAKESVVRIPYYYDIAAGALNHINLDFTQYVDTILQYAQIETSLFKVRGFGEPPPYSDNKPWCTTPMPDTFDEPWAQGNGETVAQYYLGKLAALANEQKINVYVIGGPIPETCANLGHQKPHISNMNYLKRFKSINFDYANPVVVPDNLMFNMHHVSNEGSFYFTQKVKPFFDAMPK